MTDTFVTYGNFPRFDRKIVLAKVVAQSICFDGRGVRRPVVGLSAPVMQDTINNGYTQSIASVLTPLCLYLSQLDLFQAGLYFTRRRHASSIQLQECRLNLFSCQAKFRAALYADFGGRRQMDNKLRTSACAVPSLLLGYFPSCGCA